MFGWRTVFSRSPGKLGTMLYFACLGLGYIMVEVGLIADFVLALANPTVSASVLITGMLVFSGLGSLSSERILDRARTVMPVIFLAIAVMLIAYGLLLDAGARLDRHLPYALRLVLCLALVAPPAFLMGFPMPTAMTSLARLGKDHMFIWAWGINGCFSVIGAALVPIVATTFGLTAVLHRRRRLSRGHAGLLRGAAAGARRVATRDRLVTRYFVQRAITLPAASIRSNALAFGTIVKQRSAAVPHLEQKFLSETRQVPVRGSFSVLSFIVATPSLARVRS